MSTSAAARANMERHAPAILSMTEGAIEAAVHARSPSSFCDEVLSLGSEGAYSAFYAPFDWVNDDADVVIVGITPGRQQAVEALRVFRRALLAGESLEEAARRAKDAASFKGKMRTLGARLMDHLGFHEVFGLRTTHELFEAASARAHYTSVLRYPVLKDLGNYSGDGRILKRAFLRRMIDDHLAEELGSLPNAWIVPFGPTALLVLEHLVAAGVVDPDRVLGGILHPGGQQWNRYKVQFGLVGEAEAAAVPGGKEVLRRSEALRAQVRGILNRRRIN